MPAGDLSSRECPRDNRYRPSPDTVDGLAERVGFEPTWELPPNPLSRRARYDHFGTSPTRERQAIPNSRPDDAGNQLPRAKLLPLTAQTRAVLPAAGLDIPRFPFRIGRRPGMAEASELHFNEIEIPDRQPYLLSLHHFAIDLAPEGVVVRDRGSKYGTLVNGLPIGAGVAQDVAALRPGDNEIVAGAVLLTPRHESPFRFLVQTH